MEKFALLLGAVLGVVVIGTDAQILGGWNKLPSSEYAAVKEDILHLLEERREPGSVNPLKILSAQKQVTDEINLKVKYTAVGGQICDIYYERPRQPLQTRVQSFECQEQGYIPPPPPPNDWNFDFPYVPLGYIVVPTKKYSKLRMQINDLLFSDRRPEGSYVKQIEFSLKKIKDDEYLVKYLSADGGLCGITFTSPAPPYQSDILSLECTVTGTLSSFPFQ